MNWQVIITAAGLIVIWLITQFVVLPYIRLELRRRASRRHTPQPEELWIQLRPDKGEDLLYIDAVTRDGVEVIVYNAKTKGISRWQDSWSTWSQRLEVNTIWFTGARRPLGPE